MSDSQVDYGPVLFSSRFYRFHANGAMTNTLGKYVGKWMYCVPDAPLAKRKYGKPCLCTKLVGEGHFWPETRSQQLYEEYVGRVLLAEITS